MAAPVIVSNIEVCSTPWLVRKLTITTGNTSTALTHSGPATPPDMYWAQQNVDNPTATECSVHTPTATTITVDCEGDGVASGVVVYLVWFDASAGGIS